MMKKTVFAFLLLVLLAVVVLSFSLMTGGQPEFGFSCIPGQSFSVSGQVYNTTYGNASTDFGSNISVNVSIYNMSFSGFGEPSTVFVNTTNTSSTGNFTLGVFSGSCSTNYILKIVQYNSSSWNAQAIGAEFPPLPLSAFVRVLDNGSFYLQNASTLNLSAINGSQPLTNIGDSPANYSFNYVIFDDTLGFPIAENFQTRKFNDTVIVPRGRNYTIMFMRAPDFTDPSSFVEASPPVTFSLTADQIEANQSRQYVVNVAKNLSFEFFFISGAINVTGNSTAVNMTNVIIKLGIAGLVPPNSEMGLGRNALVNITNRTGCTGSNCYIADYNITVIGASGNGIYQIVEWYAANITSTGDVGGDYFAYFNNFSVTGNVVNHNIMLRGLAGNVTTQNTGMSSITTRYISINLTNEEGQPLSDAHTELKVSMPGHKTTLPVFRYMLDQLSGGIMRLPVLNDSNVSLLVYNRRFAPKEIKLNITNASRQGTFNLKLETFRPKKFNPNGTFEVFNSSNEGSNFRIVFMRNTAACNVYNASVASCRLGNDDFDVGKFDPLKAMVAGKVNILNVINTTGVITYFIGVDMLASGPPQSDMSESHLRETVGVTRSQIWRFGSNAPDIFDKVLIGIPYNESLFNESALFNISFDYLLDENNAVIWNATTFPNGTNVPDAYSDYNVSWLNKSAGGMRCVNDTSVNYNMQQCYVNTSTNYVWMSLPHFSPDDDPILQGDPDTTPPSEAPILRAVNVSDNDMDGNIEVNWSQIDDETGETYAVFRASTNLSIFNLTNTSIINVTAFSRVGEGTMFFEDNTTVGNNATYYWYAVVAADSTGNLFNSSGGITNLSSSFNSTANDTVIPNSPVLNWSASGSSVTFRWKNVTTDVNGNPDFNGLQYKLYASGANATVNLSARNVSDATIGLSLRSTVSTNTTSFTATSTGTYHFIITSIDDNSNENRSFVISGANVNYLNLSLSVSSSSNSPSSGGSGGGGGGGQGSAASEGVSQSKLWSKLSAGSTASMAISKVEIPFTSLEFKTIAAVTDVEVTVTSTTTRPSAAKTSYSGKVYKYIEIAKSNIKDTDVSYATIKYRVPTEWLSDNSALADDVVLVRYANDKWNELKSTKVRTDPVYFYYTADSPGLSVFAVALRGEAGKAAEKAAEKAAGNETTGQAGKEGAASSRKKSLLYIAIGVIAFALAAAAAGFAYYRKKNAPPSSGS